MCVTPAWLFCRIGTPAAHSLSMFACVSQYSGQSDVRVLALVDDDPDGHARVELVEQRLRDVVDLEPVHDEVDLRGLAVDFLDQPVVESARPGRRSESGGIGTVRLEPRGVDRPSGPDSDTAC